MYILYIDKYIETDIYVYTDTWRERGRGREREGDGGRERQASPYPSMPCVCSRRVSMLLPNRHLEGLRGLATFYMEALLYFLLGWYMITPKQKTDHSQRG